MEDQPEDEKQITPDFFVDRPTTPKFIPNPEGVNRETQIEDNDLFDFDNEVEPIIEVITGKIIQQARIEVIEEYETDVSIQNKNAYYLKRDNDLIETQRLEVEHLRREKELKMRNSQQEARKKTNIDSEKKLISRVVAKSIIGPLKNATISLIKEAGILTTRNDQYIQSNLVPSLYVGAQNNITSKEATIYTIDCN